MNRLAIAATGLLLCTASACAARGGAREIFRRIDKNGDRKLEFVEIQAVRAQMFDRMDANHNGLLDADEMRAAAQQVKSKRDVQIARLAGLPDQAGRMDKNGDSALSISELRTLRRQ